MTLLIPNTQETNKQLIKTILVSKINTIKHLE